MDPLLISGLYKSGTSWLLSCLSAHYQCLGFREVDIIKSFGSLKGHTYRLFDPAKRLQTMFGKSAWCHVPASFYPTLVAEAATPGQSLLDLPTPVVIQAITEHLGHQTRKPEDTTRYAIAQNYSFLADDRLIRLYDTIREAQALPDILHVLFEEVEAEIAERGLADLRYYLFKGADQVSVLEALNGFSRPLKKIVIVRDGRDASISAVKYQALMRQRQAAWIADKPVVDLFKRLKAWTTRAEMVLEQMKGEDYYILHYEDLSLRFHETFGALLTWLGLDAAPTLIDQIQKAKSFEAVTGRKRGQEEAAVIRKGAVREWAEALSEQEKDQAWAIAGKQLSALGYPER